jgi:hypothetical protein
VTFTRWERLLGYTCTVQDSEHSTTVTLSALEPLRRMFQHHVEDKLLIKPRHPYPGSINQCTIGTPPDADSPEYSAFVRMQSLTRAGLGFSIWANARAPQHGVLHYLSVRVHGQPRLPRVQGLAA